MKRKTVSLYLVVEIQEGSLYKGQIGRIETTLSPALHELSLLT